MIIHEEKEFRSERVISRRNIDGEEILGWMRDMVKTSGFGLIEVPIHKGIAIGRFFDTDTLKDGNMVLSYTVQKHGLYRNWIEVNTHTFQNNGRCTVLSCISKKSLENSVLRYKVGKKTGMEGYVAISKFYESYMNMVKTGMSSRDFVKRVMEEELGFELEKNWTIDDLNKLCKNLVDSHPTDYPSWDDDSQPNRVCYPTS